MGANLSKAMGTRRLVVETPKDAELAHFHREDIRKQGDATPHVGFGRCWKDEYECVPPFLNHN